MERLAEPPDRGTVPSTAAPSRKTTEPVGVPDPPGSGATEATSVTVWPGCAGLGEAVSVVATPALTTVCDRAADTPAAWIALPE